MTKLQFRPPGTTSQISYRRDLSRLTPCPAGEQCECCSWLKTFTLWAWFECEDAGCAEFGSCVGSLNQLTWNGAANGHCDEWEYINLPAQLLSCADPPGPALDIGHYVWLYCDGNDQFTADVCLNANNPTPPVSPGDCTQNILGLTPVSVLLVCNDPTDPDDPGMLEIDFGYVEFGDCPPGCGWRLRIITQSDPTPPPPDCSFCIGPQDTTIDIELNGLSNRDCDDCTGLGGINGTYSVARTAGNPCIYESTFQDVCTAIPSRTDPLRIRLIIISATEVFCEVYIGTEFLVSFEETGVDACAMVNQSLTRTGFFGSACFTNVATCVINP